MKKLMAALMAAITVLCLVACGQGDESGTKEHGFKNDTSTTITNPTSADNTATTTHNHSDHTTTVVGGSSNEDGTSADIESTTEGLQGGSQTTTTQTIITTTKKGETTTTNKTTTTTTTTKKTTTTTKKTTTTTTKKTTSSTKKVTTTINSNTVKNHTFVAASYTKVDMNLHKAVGKCAVCGASVTQTETHNWGAWKYDSYPTATKEGVKYRNCTGCGEEQVTAVPATSSNTANFPKQMMDLVNAERAKYGLPAYQYYTAAQSGANTRAKELMEYFSHNRPDGSKWWTVASFDKSVCQAGAENIARGYGSPEDVIAAVMGSPDHRKNILSTQYTHIVVGYYEDAWVQIFTKPW